ncbi:hypothetical protein ACFLWV_03760 [Chloroflexota bacterium]
MKKVKQSVKQSAVIEWWQWQVYIYPTATNTPKTMTIAPATWWKRCALSPHSIFERYTINRYIMKLLFKLPQVSKNRPAKTIKIPHSMCIFPPVRSRPSGE